MIRFCAEAGLPEPQFRSEGAQFIATVWRDWLTDDVLADNEGKAHLRSGQRQVGIIEIDSIFPNVKGDPWFSIAGDMADNTLLPDFKLMTPGEHVFSTL